MSGKRNIQDVLFPVKRKVYSLGFLDISSVSYSIEEGPARFEALGVWPVNNDEGAVLVYETASSFAEIKKLASKAHAQVMSLHGPKS